MITRDTTANLVGRVGAKTLVVTPDGPAQIPALPEGVSVSERPGGTLAFGYDARVMGAGTVLDAIRAGGMRIADVRTEEADLEDVFLQLTSKAREPSSAA